MVKTWVAGWLSLSTAWLTHEVVSMGIGQGYLTGERNLGSGVYPATFSGIVAEAFVFAALASFLLVAVKFFVGVHAGASYALGLAWLGLCFLGFFTTALGYTAYGGATWRWFEPFFAWMWSPWMTPLICLTCVAPFLWITRKPVR